MIDHGLLLAGAGAGRVLPVVAPENEVDRDTFEYGRIVRRAGRRRAPGRVRGERHVRDKALFQALNRRPESVAQLDVGGATEPLMPRLGPMETTGPQSASRQGERDARKGRRTPLGIGCRKQGGQPRDGSPSVGSQLVSGGPYQRTAGGSGARMPNFTPRAPASCTAGWNEQLLSPDSMRVTAMGDTPARTARALRVTDDLPEVERFTSDI